MDLRTSILAAPDLAKEAVALPLWGVTVYVSAMSGHARSQWAAVAFDSDGHIKEPAREILLVHTVTDENGTAIFTMDDVNELSKKNAAYLSQLFTIAKRLNALGSDEVDEAEKN